jgi:hypothetical protein
MAILTPWAIPNGVASAAWWGVGFKSTVQSFSDPRLAQTIARPAILQLQFVSTQYLRNTKLSFLFSNSSLY